MAELAVAAAATQFITLGGSISSSLSKIIAECRDAPHRISILRGEVQQLIKLVQITQSNAAVAAVFNASVGRELLSDTIGKAQRLQRLLAELHVDSDKNLAVKTWAAVRTVKKDSELNSLCEGLERQKTSLLIWFANHNLENNLGIASSLKALGGKIEGINESAGESLPVVQEINDRTDTIHQEAKAANQEHIAGMKIMKRQLECLGGATTESLPLVRDIDIRTKSIHQEVKVAAKENKANCQTLASRVDDLRDLNNHSVPLMRVLDERTQNIRNDLQLVGPSIQDSEQRIESMIKSEFSRPLAELQASLTALMTIKEAHVTQVQAHQSTIAKAQYQLISKPSALQSACDTLRKEDSRFAGKPVWDVKHYRICACAPKRQTHNMWKGWRYWQLSGESYSQHSVECPFYPNTQKTKSVRIRCMLQTWFLSRIIDYTFSITSGAGGFAISPQLTVIRMVDENGSAFRMVWDLAISMFTTRNEANVQHFEDGIANLRRLFCAGEASPFDVSRDGQTLLHSFVTIVNFMLDLFWTWDRIRTDRIWSESLALVLSMCTILGIGKENMRHHVPWRSGQNTMCFPCAHWSRIFLYLHVNEGWQLSEFSNYLGRQGTIKACLQFPQFIEDSDFGPVSQAILAKREARLRELIGLGYDLWERDRFGWTPLHLSVNWPLGMSILFAAGVQHNGGDLNSGPFTPLEYAIDNGQDESVLLLLGIGAMRDFGSNRLLGMMARRYEPSSHIVTATIEFMIQRSNCLRSLAIANLSPCELDSLCISYKDGPIQVLDAYAAPTANALKNLGVKIPEYLDPGRYRATVFHDGPHMSPELADRLWSSGFRDTNVHDEHGLTPLHQACLPLKVDMASWLMSRGGDPTTVVRDYSLNAFHLLSGGLSNWDHVSSDGSHNWDLEELLADLSSRDLFIRIASLCGVSCHDDCQCACSPQGCTPTTILLRRATCTWYCKKEIFSSWCRCLDLSPDVVETCCLEFARVETFDRLGITHICCKLKRHVLLMSDSMPQDTMKEIQDEESEMIDQLESWMALYEEERAKFEGPAIEFLGKWSDILKNGLDVPTPFEEHWSWRVKEQKSTCMPDYFT